MSRPRFTEGEKIRLTGGGRGTVERVFASFAQVPFLTEDPDTWLAVQKIPATPADLKSPWYDIRFGDLGAAYIRERLLSAATEAAQQMEYE